MLNRKTYIIAATITTVYLLIAIFIVSDYGITTDAPGDFRVGHKYLHFYLTGDLNFSDNTPVIEDHPNFTTRASVETPYHHWPFVNILSAVTCTVFFRWFGLLDPIAAHHVIGPIITSVFLFILFIFIEKHWGRFIAVISVMAIITYPRFFGHSLNNIKDVPEMLFNSATIFLFVEWLYSRKLKYLYFTFILWGIALATKLNAILVPVILFLWLIPDIVKELRKGDIAKYRILLHFLVGGIISIVIFIISYPPLLPWAYETDALSHILSFIGDKIEYIIHIGTEVTRVRNPSWNLYAPSQIFFATPVVMLLLFLSGLVRIFYKDRRKMNILLIIWLFFIVGRHCLPNTNHYDGIRHFIIYVVPVAIITSLGMAYIIELLSSIKRLKVNKRILSVVLPLSLLIPNVSILLTYHPYQTTYFTPLVGGLKRAQEKNLECCYDYWLNSYKEVGEWLNKNAVRDAYYYTFHTTNILTYSIKRDDLKGIFTRRLVPIPPPPNTYFVLMAMDVIPDQHRWLFEKVHEVKRRGGRIFEIYFVSKEKVESIKERIKGEEADDKKVLNEVIYELKESLKTNVATPDIYNYLGVAYYKKGDLKNAEIYFRKALQLDSSYKDARTNLDHILTQK